MQSASHSLRVRASRAAVWEVLADPARAADWAYGVRKVEFVTDARRGVGAQWRQTEVYGPVVVVRLVEVTAAEDGVAFHVESVTHPRLEARWSLEDAPDEAGELWTRLTLDLELELPGNVGRAAEPALGEFVGRTIARRSAEALKRLVEQREARKRDEPPVVP